MRRRGDDGRTLATVLFTDIVGSTELASELGDVHWKQVLATHHGVVRKTLKRYNGHEVDTAGDGFFATFARPADAIRCASDIIDQLRAIGIHIRAGVHMGEVEQMGAKVGGIAVHIGARVAAKAGADQILVSSTVRDLVAGSDIRFGQGDLYDLKGVPGEWRLMSVERELAADVPAKPLIEAPQAKAARKKTIPIATVAIAAALVVVLVVVLVLTLGGGTSNVVAVPGANTLSVIDTRSNRFAGTSDVGNAPADATAGAGSIWVLNTSDQTFSQVDSKTGKVLSNARSVGGAPTGIAFGAGSVWIATGFGNTAGNSGSVLRFDTTPGGPKKVIDVGSGISSISFGDGALWVTNSLTNTVSKVDPDANAVVSTIKVGNSPNAVVAGNGSVWVANTLDNSVWKIDETSNRVMSKVTLLSPPTGLALQGNSTLWIVSATGNTVSRVDTSSGTTVATVPVGAQPLAIVAGEGGVWIVADAGHDVERINAATSTVSARLKVDGSPDGIAMDGERVWVSVQK